MSGSSTINSASVFAVPNSLVARDRFSSTWINGIIMKGANYVASNINRDLTKNNEYIKVKPRRVSPVSNQGKPNQR